MANIFSSIGSSISNALKGIGSTVSNAVSSLSGKKTTQLGSVIVKPEEVSKVSKGTSYSVPATGESGVKGVSKSSGTAKTSTNLVPTGNIQEELATTTGGNEIQIPGTSGSNAKKLLSTAANILSGAQSGTSVTAQEGEKLSAGQKIYNLIFGNNLEVNPLTGVPNTDAEGNPIRVAASTFPGFNLAGSAIGSLGGTVGLLDKTDDIANSVKYANSLSKANNMIQGYEKVANAIQNGDEILTGVNAAAAAGNTVTSVAGIAVNTATTTKKFKAILDLVKSNSKTGLWVAGALATWITTGSFAANEHRDAEASLQFAITDANQNGDYATAKKLKDYYDDIATDKLYMYLGPIGYFMASGVKATAASKIIEESMATATVNQEKELRMESILLKINAGLATDDEISEYVTANPYSTIAKLYQQELTNQQYAENAIALQQQLEDIKTAGAEARDALYEDSTTTSETTTYELPSSLNFGLLHTSGGYEATKSGDLVSDQTYTVTDNVDYDSISNYLFGIPYSQLTAEQKAVVDKW